MDVTEKIDQHIQQIEAGITRLERSRNRWALSSAIWSAIALLALAAWASECRGEDLRPLLNAIAKVESGGRELAPYYDVNGLAIGPFSIHKEFAKDVGRDWKRCRERAYAEKTVVMYWARYKANSDYERAVMINCGPGWRKNRKAADRYWAKVKGNMKGRER